MTKRKRHPEEFKREAVRLFEERGDRPAREVAESLGVAESQLYDWRKKYGQVAEGRLKHRGESAEPELRRPRQEVTPLTKERDLQENVRVLREGQQVGAMQAIERASLRPPYRTTSLGMPTTT